MSDHKHVIDFVKSYSTGPCSCYYINGRCSISTYDPVTGLITPGDSDPGSKVECARCRARSTLEADGIDYVKDDRAFYTTYNGGGGCAANMGMPSAQTFVVTGSLHGL